MKKIISLVLMIAMLFSMSAFAVEEEFTLHNGTKFGMSQNEVIEIEKQKEFIIKRDSDIWFPTEAMSGNGTIANQPNTDIVYGFKDDSLYYMEYTFPNLDTYETIENSLTNKYGETEYSSKTGFEFPKFNAEEGFRSLPFISFSASKSLKYVLSNYSHRLIFISDTEAVFIEHYSWIGDSNGSIYTSEHCLRYYLLTTDELNTIQQGINQLDSDL